MMLRVERVDFMLVMAILCMLPSLVHPFIQQWSAGPYLQVGFTTSGTVYPPDCNADYTATWQSAPAQFFTDGRFMPGWCGCTMTQTPSGAYPTSNGGCLVYSARDVSLFSVCRNQCIAGQYAAVACTSCQDCAPGSYAAPQGSTQYQPRGCTLCEAGKAQPNWRSGSCNLCLAGQYSNSGAVSCTGCPVGQYQPYEGQGGCFQCNPGYSTQGTYTSCTPCGPGTYSSTPSLYCTACTAGKYSTAVQATSVNTCSSCATGKYSSTAGATSPDTCLSCAAGKYSTATAATSVDTCTSCVAGKYSGAGAGSCILCPAGKYFALTGASVCTSCVVGKYGTVTGGTSETVCTPCPAGKYSTTAGAQACTSCAAGKYSTVSGGTSETVCTFCAAGTYNATTGSTACTACATGTYNGTSGSTACTACTLQCPTGSVVANHCNATTNLRCTVCPAGTYSPGVWYTVCTPCVAGSNFSPNNSSTECTACKVCPYESGSYTISACTPTKDAVCGNCTDDNTASFLDLAMRTARYTGECQVKCVPGYTKELGSKQCLPCYPHPGLGMVYKHDDDGLPDCRTECDLVHYNAIQIPDAQVVQNSPCDPLLAACARAEPSCITTNPGEGGCPANFVNTAPCVHTDFELQQVQA